MSGREPYYLTASFADGGAFESVRDDAFESARPPASGHHRVEPHLTAHPGFSAEPSALGAVENAAEVLEGNRVRTEGFEAYPSWDEPHVVMLSLDVEGLRAVRRAVGRALDRHPGSTEDRDPVPPHATLFKTGDSWGDTDGGPPRADPSGLPEPPRIETRVASVDAETRY